LKFLVDNQLPPALARFIAAELQAETAHVSDLSLRDSSDADIWQYATANDLVVISKDENFASMCLQKPTAKLIWVRIGNCRREYLLDLFRELWPRIVVRLEAGDRMIEIR
jgi:predicted nuclease of predicted toxin-antitoxin system